MYSVVMLMALQGGGMDVPEFGRRRGGCHGCYGGYSCCGCWGGGYSSGCWGGGYGGYGGCWGGGYGGYGGCWGSSYAMPYAGGYPAWGGAGYRSRYYMPDSGVYYQGGGTQPYYDGGRGDRMREMRQEEGGAVDRGPDRSRGTTPDRGTTTPDRRGTTPDRGTTPPGAGDRSRDQRQNEGGVRDTSPDRRQGRADAPATLLVQLPAGARLTVDGAPTRSASDSRAFITPPLPGGRDFHYTLQAQLTRNGQTSTVSREVTVRAGEETQVRIEFPEGTVAQR